MKTAHLLGFILLLFSFSSYALVKESGGKKTHNVLFHSDHSDITEEQARKIDNIFADQAVVTRQIRLVGHTDSDGSDAYNVQLSRRRVEEVRDYLLKLGYSRDQIVMDFKGENVPVGDNATDEGKAQNRRVTIEWEFDEQGDIRDLYKLLEQEEQEFCFDPKKDAILTLSQGTIIMIPAGTYITSCSKCVTLRTKEIYKQSDMIMENLSTTSNGRLLETGGMIYTEVEDCNGNRLDIRPGKRMSILLPTENPRDDMELFYGERDPHSDLMNWIRANEQQGGGGMRLLNDYGDCREKELVKIPPCGERCGIFFCRLFGRIDETAKGMVNRDQHLDNKEFRRCQRNLRKGLSPSTEVRNGNCDSLYAEYGVSNWQELQDKLRKIEVKRQEEALKNGQGSANSLSFYVANVSRTGWMNCDAFTGYEPNDLISMRTALLHNREEDSQLIFKDRRSAMKPDASGSTAKFSAILPGLAVWLLHLKYSGNRIFIGLKGTTTQENGGNVEMREVTLDGLKTELRKLDD